MSQVSRRQLDRDVEGKVTETLLEAISQLSDRGDIQLFLDDLLSPTERIMLAKRLSIAVLLLKGWGYRSIGNFLKVSNETVAKVSLIIKTNIGYKKAIDKLLRTQAGKEFWQDIGSLLYRLSSPGKTFMEEEAIRHKLGFKKKNLL